MIASLLALVRGESGKAPVKLVFSTCVIAIAVASASPVFQAHPLLGKTIMEVRERLPDTFDTITRAMGG